MASSLDVLRRLDEIEKGMVYLRVQLKNVLANRDDPLFHKEYERINNELSNLTIAYKSLAAALQELAHREAAVGGSGGGEAAGTALYNDITLYTPVVEGYIKRHFRHTTRRQLASKLQSEGFRQVVVQVDKEPSEMLHLWDCRDAIQDIDDIELQDGMQLAVPLLQGLSSMEQLTKRVTHVEQEAAATSGWQRGIIKGSGFKCSEWMMDHLAGDAGVCSFCYSMLSSFVEGSELKIEIDGMASSDVRVVLGECKPIINLEYVEQVKKKQEVLRKLVEARAPNTDKLLDHATGSLKPLETFIMADGWVDNPAEQAACAVRMAELKITPLLPRGDSYTVGDSCHSWPPTQTEQRLAENFFNRKATQQQQTDAARHAGHGAPRGGPTSAVCPEGSSQAAACGPTFSGCLHVHAHRRVAIGQWRTIAPCRPAPLVRLLAARSQAVVRAL